MKAPQPSESVLCRFKAPDVLLLRIWDSHYESWRKPLTTGINPSAERLRIATEEPIHHEHSLLQVGRMWKIIMKTRRWELQGAFEALGASPSRASSCCRAAPQLGGASHGIMGNGREQPSVQVSLGNTELRKGKYVLLRKDFFFSFENANKQESKEENIAFSVFQM